MIKMPELNHFDSEGNAVMVDVSAKTDSSRVASASASVLMQSATMQLIIDKGVKKGDVLSVARLAGIMGAKKTPELIPLCHPLSLTSVELLLTCDTTNNSIEIVSTCKVNGPTGVEMEALTAVSIAALTVYDMCKAVDREMHITDVHLRNKSGGKSGDWSAD
jgi:cyclic pyranopterin phosphate synthase